LDKAPDAFRTISEVAEELEIPQHVLRFWETRFAQIKPMKRSGGRRFYRPEDVDLLRGIRRLLYAEGYTIRGVQRILKEQGVKSVQSIDANPLRGAQTLQQAVQRPVVAIPLPERASEVHARQEAVAAAAHTGVELDGRSGRNVIVVNPPASKPFTTPLPSLEILPVPVSSFEAVEPIDDVPAAAEIRSMPFGQSSAPTAAERNSQLPAFAPRPPDMRKLRNALSELIACREMIERALQEPDPAA